MQERNFIRETGLTGIDYAAYVPSDEQVNRTQLLTDNAREQAQLKTTGDQPWKVSLAQLKISLADQDKQIGTLTTEVDNA